MFGNELWERVEWKENSEKEKMEERDNILQENARPCRELADEYLLESTKD